MGVMLCGWRRPGSRLLLCLYYRMNLLMYLQPPCVPYRYYAHLGLVEPYDGSAATHNTHVRLGRQAANSTCQAMNLNPLTQSTVEGGSFSRTQCHALPIVQADAPAGCCNLLCWPDCFHRVAFMSPSALGGAVEGCWSSPFQAAVVGGCVAWRALCPPR